MSIVKALFDQSVISTDECFGQPDVTSQEMRAAINAWRDTYLKREGDKASDPCMRMAYVIVHKLQKGVFAEYSSDILDKEKTAKGKWMDRNLSQLDLIRDSVLQWMLIGGECWVKPVPRPAPDGSTIFVPLLVHRTDAVILAREPDGRVTSIVTAEHTARGSQYYTLLERRTVDANGYLTIENKLYASFDRGTLGVRTALSKLDRYAQLPDLYTYPVPVGGVGMTPLRVPLANCVDGSMDAISIYEPAMGLIRNIDQNEKQLNDEFEMARHRLIAPAEMLKTGRDGRRTLDDSVFVALKDIHSDLAPTAFTPQLRDEPYERREQKYLRAIENQIGLKRGMLSDAQEVEKTAFEVASTAGDYNLSLLDLQQVWFDGVREYLTLCDTLGKMYRYCDQSAWDVTEQLAITWGNGVLYDPDGELETDLRLVAAQLLKPEIAVARHFDQPWENEEDLKNVREKYMPAMEELEPEA
mgnify:FL=1|nr:MAG TPA_asm: portal protein [Caudoviricetes sp.]